MKKLNKLFSKIDFKVFLLIFFAFYLYEYGSPVINAINIGKNLGMSLSDLLGDPTTSKQVLKHVIRLPLYFIFYAALFYYIKAKKLIAYRVMQFLLIMHLIFKPAFIVIITLFLTRNEFIRSQYDLGIKPLMIYLWALAIAAIYLFFIFYLKYYWQSIDKSTKKKK